MRRYRVEVAGRTHVIDVNELSAHQFKVRVGSQDFTVHLSAAEDVPEAVISPDMADAVGDSGEAEPLSPAQFRPAAPDTLPSMVPAAPPSKIAPPPLRAVKGSLAAPMPGTIVSIEVNPGDTVTNGQVLLKLEAMKMINAIKSPRDGRIASIAVQAGQGVTYGQVLITFAEE